jgi:hypothetical protein
MPFLGLVEVVGRLPSLYFVACVLVVGWCTVMEISSFFRLGSRPSAAPVAYLHATLLLGSVPPMPTTLDSL